MSVIERVARAMWSKENPGLSWDDSTHERTRAKWMARARTAIEGMREPTEAMVEAMTTFVLDEWDDPDPTAAALAWQNAIDAALSEKP